MAKDRLRPALAGAVLVLLAAWNGCSAPQPAAQAQPTARMEEHHPATFDEAKVLAAERNVPLLMDFYSPT